jgi:hypothetical protein
MSYIGNTPISVAFLTDTFSGNGSTTAFTMTVAPANTSSILVAVTGVVQDPSTYSVSGTTLTFSGAPPSGTSNISVRYLGIPASGVTTTAYRTVTNFTATAGQTSFSVPSYTIGYIDVYRNGVRLVSTDFTATTGTTVVLTNACTVGDAVVTESFYVSSVLNAIPATAGSVSDSYIVGMSASKLTGSRTIPKGTMPAGSVLQVVNTMNGAVATGTTTIPQDNTIPQITEGTEFMTLAITPTSATSKLRIDVVINGAGSSSNSWATALFQDSTVNALAATNYNMAANNVVSYSGFTHFMTSGTTSSTTFRVRCGTVGAGTFTFNGAAAAQIFGGVMASSITITEIAA